MGFEIWLFSSLWGAFLDSDLPLIFLTGFLVLNVLHAGGYLLRKGGDN